MFTYFTDRDGKFQLLALAESGFDPLARTTRFMLMEEAHHMYVGESGVARVIQRTCEVMAQHKTDDPARLRELGVIDLPTIQRYLNFHFSVTIDLFGADVSSNAATFYSSGLKGRYEETKFTDDHLLRDAVYPVLQVLDGRLATGEAAGAQRAQREAARRLHQGFRRRCRTVEPHHPKGRHPVRVDGPAQGVQPQDRAAGGDQGRPDGTIVSEAEWAARQRDWLATDEDRAFVASLMGRVTATGAFANWIAPPTLEHQQAAGRFRVRALQLTGGVVRAPLQRKWGNRRRSS